MQKKKNNTTGDKQQHHTRKTSTTKEKISINMKKLTISDKKSDNYYLKIII